MNSTTPLTRRGPYVHALIGETWAQRRAFLVRRSLRCGLCCMRVKAGETVVRTPGGPGFACGWCIPTRHLVDGHDSEDEPSC